MIVMTRHQDNVEVINKTLRNAGLPAHVNWLPDARELGDALTQILPQMVIIFAEEGVVDLKAALEFRARCAAEVPVLLVHKDVDEETIARAMQLGAQDAVTLDNLDRLRLVVSRELQTYRLNRALSSTLSAAKEYQRQLRDFMQGSTDAIAQVQEGIVVEANPSWVELLGHKSGDELVGTPLMDSFEPDSHTALKGALVACLQGRWSDHVLRASVRLPDGSAMPLELQLAKSEYEGEPSVRLSVSASHRDVKEMERQLADAIHRDPATGFLHRGFFLDELRKRLAEAPKGGVRHIAYVEPDKLEDILSELGVLSAEEFLVQFAQALRENLQPGDLAGRFAGNGFMMLLHRGNNRDIEAWAEQSVRRISTHVFQLGDKSISTTCTVGLGLVPPSLTDPAGPASDAYRANRRGREIGGNRVHTLEHTDALLKQVDKDKLWVRQIKLALMENRFRLVQQPIASLLGDERNMFDVLVRMVDEAGNELLPSEFIPVAERNDLMKNIDRWVIGASMSFCASRRPGALFVRLSRHTLADASLTIWLSNQLKASKIEAQRIVFQASEEAASVHLKDTAALQGKLKDLGFRFAIDGFGSGRDTETMMGHLQPDFVKIHGGLMQGLATDLDNQQRVRALVDLARARGATTIAERVEDANTMAALWQLGVEYIQGYFVNAPEEVVLGQ